MNLYKIDLVKEVVKNDHVIGRKNSTFYTIKDNTSEIYEDAIEISVSKVSLDFLNDSLIYEITRTLVDNGCTYTESDLVRELLECFIKGRED